MWLENNRLPIRFVLHDCDTKSSFGFERVLYHASVRRVRTPLLARHADAFVESWIGGFKRECLNHSVLQ